MKSIRSTAFAGLALGALAFAAPGMAAECENMETLTVVSWGCQSRLAAHCLAMMEEDGKPSIYTANCLDVHPIIHKEVKTIRPEFRDNDEIDAALTFEPALGAMQDVVNGTLGKDRLPVLAGAFASNNFVIMTTKEVGDLAGQVLGTGRCSDTDEISAGVEWRDVTDPANETYRTESPSINTIMMFEWVRAAIGVELPKDTGLVCGKRFTTDGASLPMANGSPVVYVEAGLLSPERTERLKDGTYAAITAFAEFAFGARTLIPNMAVVTDVGAADIPASGIYAFPEKLAAKRDAFCRMNEALMEATGRLRAGTITKTGDGYVFDEAAESAYETFLKVVAYERTDIALDNYLASALLVKNQEGTGDDVEATEDARRDFFVFAREHLWRSSSAPSDAELDQFSDWFKLTESGAALTYQDPCV